CFSCLYFFFFVNAPATPEIYTLSLHDALPISILVVGADRPEGDPAGSNRRRRGTHLLQQSCAITIEQFADDGPGGTPINLQAVRSEEHTSELQSRFDLVCRLLLEKKKKKEK